MTELRSCSSTAALAPEDLEVLQTFLQAWCEENNAEITDKAAVEVASGLIDWYLFALGDRSLLKPPPIKLASEPAELQRLLRKLECAQMESVD